jgi:L-lactate dehydrogenase
METNASPQPSENRIAIVGVGHVGVMSAYALMFGGLAREIVLVDLDRARAEGEAMDLSHAAALARPVTVRAGDYRDAASASVVVITAGVAGRAGESRLDLLGRNAVVARAVVAELMENGFDGIILMATNPVDVLAHVAFERSGLPSDRVLSSGTVLDSARLRALLAEELAVDARSVHAYVVGEHGDSEIAAWSCARVAGVPLFDYPGAERLPSRAEMLDRVRRAAPDIIERKGYTSFAIATCVGRICEAILRDTHTVLPVSSLMRGEYGVEGIYLSTPCIVGRRGVERRVELPLDAEELEGLHASADVLGETLRSLARDAGR